jgi:hypothetical protein
VGASRRAWHDRNEVWLWPRACGACTVHIDGQPTRSCVLSVAAVEGKSITDNRGDRQQRTPAPASSGPGSTSRWSSAAIASRAKSCRRRRCCKRKRARATPTSTPR